MPDADRLWNCTSPDGTLYFRVEGKSTFYISSELRRCAEERIAGGATAVRVDLRQCDYVDSTFVGTLLIVKQAADAHGCPLALLDPSPDCRQVLDTMGLDRILDIQPADVPEVAWTCMVGAPDPDTCRRDMTDAHRALGELPGPTGATFKPIADRMAAEQSKPRDDRG